MSDFIPNSFQMPNAYVDRFWHLLTSEEKDVLVYIARRIYGFGGKSRDAISLSQFVDGIVTKEGKRLDFGTGLSRTKVLRALESLIAFRLVILVCAAVKFPPAARRPAIYALQLDSFCVNAEAMQLRFEQKRLVGKSRVQQANLENAARRNGLCGTTDVPQGEVRQSYQQLSSSSIKSKSSEYSYSNSSEYNSEPDNSSFSSDESWDEWFGMDT